jgi:hypothetical protein
LSNICREFRRRFTQLILFAGIPNETSFTLALRPDPTHVVLEPLGCFTRLAALVPRPQIGRFIIRASIWWITPRTFVAGALDIASANDPNNCCRFGK